jgi:UDP-N-acetylglucosamine--N-acetylmuramyl-(pentapeptide) pyrophosphoryl-undecaprenol N-acetylglucosamine transferase
VTFVADNPLIICTFVHSKKMKSEKKIMEGNQTLKVIVSGGGTGGHIFPAVSIANAIKKKHPEAEILFVGAEGRMEMQRVPAAGYKIVGLPVRGLVRPLWNPKNISVMMDFLKSKKMVKQIILDFKPQVAVGVGGYASAPTLNAAYSLGIPCLIQEQNSYAGVTNKSLAKKANKICVAYSGMERFFPADKILMTGNPVRQNLLENKISKEEARKSFGLDPNKKTVLMIGGSLGARTMNESVLAHLDEIRQSDVQFIWQTGKYYSQSIAEELNKQAEVPNMKVMDFISSMDNAYAAADIVVSRAGASSISELCLLGKPSILVPSPNVAEDHQTKNAQALSNQRAAILVTDKEAKDKLIGIALKTVADDTQLMSLGENAKKLAFLNSADVIAEEVYKLAVEYNNKKK